MHRIICSYISKILSFTSTYVRHLIEIQSRKFLISPIGSVASTYCWISMLRCPPSLVTLKDRKTSTRKNHTSVPVQYTPFIVMSFHLYFVFWSGERLPKTAPMISVRVLLMTTTSSSFSFVVEELVLEILLVINCSIFHVYDSIMNKNYQYCSSCPLKRLQLGTVHVLNRDGCVKLTFSISLHHWIKRYSLPQQRFRRDRAPFCKKSWALLFWFTPPFGFTWRIELHYFLADAFQSLRHKVHWIHPLLHPGNLEYWWVVGLHRGGFHWFVEKKQHPATKSFKLSSWCWIHDKGNKTSLYIGHNGFGPGRQRLPVFIIGYPSLSYQ